MSGRKEVNPIKLNKVDKLKEILEKYPNIGIINMHNMPAAQLGIMRKSLHGRARILMEKKTIMLRAFPEKLNGLKKYLDGQPALVLTEENPFKLYKFMQENKTKAPAKIGDISPIDIEIPAGDTGIPPGPAIGTFGNAGVIASVKDGSIHVLRNVVMVKEGDIITQEHSQVLGMLKIEPMEIGLDMIAIHENDMIFEKSVLKIDEEEFMNNLNRAIQHSINLAVEVGYPTKQTLPLIIGKLMRHVKSLSIEAGIYSKSVIGEILGKSQMEATALSSLVPDTPTEISKEEIVEEQSVSSESQDAPTEEVEAKDDNGGAE